jgi:hypothetical protein
MRPCRENAVHDLGAELARRRVTLRLDGHLVHVISGGVLAMTLPSPPPGPVSAQCEVPGDGVIMVTRQRLRVGATSAGKKASPEPVNQVLRWSHPGRCGRHARGGPGTASVW